MNDNEYYKSCDHCGRPMVYCKGQCCGKTQGCQCKEYGPKVCGAIRPGEPKCPYQAVIPSLTVESVSNLKDLADCFVHVSDINTTFYIDDKHRIMTTWAGLVSVDDYDFDANPLNLRDQIAYDSKNNVAAIYDKQGANYIFQISDINNDYLLLSNKPSINGVELSGNKTAADLGIPDVDEVALVFDTVADMKLATNLTNGSYARTLGFHAVNDGGGATYKITNSGTANEMDVIAVGSLFANLVYGNEINVKQLGAYADDIHDDADIIKRAIALVKSIVIPRGTYLLNSELVIEGSYDTSSYHIDCDGTLHTTATNGLVILGSYHRVYIYKFLGNGSNTLVKFTTNDTYPNTGYSQINLQTGSSCANAIAFLPTRGGILYNDITFSNLNASNACILFKTDDVNRSYINENHFTGGRCGNGTGVKMVKGEAQTDRYDGNHFEHLGFEDIDCGIDIEYAHLNTFYRCRTNESLNGDYWVKVAENCSFNYFSFQVIPVNKIQDLNNTVGRYNTYEGTLEIEGIPNASSMRMMMGGTKVFPNKYDFYKYQSYVNMYNQTSGALTADYYYNGMVFYVGADEVSNISLHLTDAFTRCGVTTFYIFIRKLVSGSTFEIKDKTNTSVTIRSSNFTAPLENKMYKIEFTPKLSDTGNDWSVTSVFRV